MMQYDVMYCDVMCCNCMFIHTAIKKISTNITTIVTICSIPVPS